VPLHVGVNLPIDRCRHNCLLWFVRHVVCDDASHTAMRAVALQTRDGHLQFGLFKTTKLTVSRRAVPVRRLRQFRQAAARLPALPPVCEDRMDDWT